MNQLSEKYLNMTILKSLTDPDISIKDDNGVIQDGTVFYTSFGIVIGGLFKNGSNSNLAQLFLEEKKKALNNFDINNFKNNGEIICVKNASILQNNGKVVYNDCLFIYVDSILGFSLCNLEEAKSEFMNM